MIPAATHLVATTPFPIAPKNDTTNLQPLRLQIAKNGICMREEKDKLEYVESRKKGEWNQQQNIAD